MSDSKAKPAEVVEDGPWYDADWTFGDPSLYGSKGLGAEASLAKTGTVRTTEVVEDSPWYDLYPDSFSYSSLGRSKALGADYQRLTPIDKPQSAEASFTKTGTVQTAEVDMGPWAPLLDFSGPVLPKDINSTDNQLEDATVRKFGSFSSDWMLWKKDELERQGTKKLLMSLLYLINYAFSSAMAIHNSSYPASSNESPLFSISHQSSPHFSSHSSPLFTMSNNNSPHIYSNGPGADHGSSITTSTSLAGVPFVPFECAICGGTFSTAKSCERHGCFMSSSIEEMFRERHDYESVPSEGAQFSTSSPSIGSFAIGDRNMGGSAFPVPERLEKKNWECPHPTCKRKGKLAFNRLESLIRHSRSIHNQHVLRKEERESVKRIRRLNRMREMERWQQQKETVPTSQHSNSSLLPCPLLTEGTSI